MTTKLYIGERHVFSNENGNTVYIEPKYGQTLNIAGYTPAGSIAADTQVIYNSGGDLVGDADLTYDGAGQLTTIEITGKKYTNDLDLNQLSEETVRVFSGSVADTREQGFSVAMSELYAVAGAPYYVSLNNSLGGECVYLVDAGNFTEYGSLLTCTTFTLTGYNGYYSDINEDSTRIVFSDKGDGPSGLLSVYDRTGATWNANGFVDGVSCKISGDYLVSGNYTKEVNAYHWNGATWDLEQVISATGTSGLYDVFDIIGENTICVYYASGFYQWTRSVATWSLQQIDVLLDVWISINLFGDYMACCSTSNFYIYKRAAFGAVYALVQTFPITNILDCCFNGTYFFVLSDTVIKIYSLVGSTWTKSVNDTAVIDGYKIACNSGYVTVGCPTYLVYGGIRTFKIDTYTNTLVDITSVNLNNSSNALELTSSYGTVEIVGDTNLTGNLDVTGYVAGEYTGTFPSGTLAAPGVRFTTDPNTGIYNSAADTLDLVVGGSLKTQYTAGLTNNINPVRFISGSAGTPSFHFGTDTDTGLYGSAGAVKVSTDAALALEANATNIVAYNNVLAPVGLVSACSYGFSTRNAGTGLWSSGAAIDFAIDGTNVAQFNAIGLVGGIPYLAPSGTASNPGFAFSLSQNTGMYYLDYDSGDYMRLAVNGTQALGIIDPAIIPNKSTVAINRAVVGNASDDASGESLAVGSTYPQTAIGVYQDTAGTHNAITFRNSNGLVGNIQCSGTSTAFNTSSDRRLKQNFKTFDGLDIVNKTKVYEYEWKCNNEKSHGVIADELNELIPSICNIVDKSHNDQKEKTQHIYDSVNYTGLVPVLIKAVQQLSQQVKDLQKELVDFQDEYDQMIVKNNLQG